MQNSQDWLKANDCIPLSLDESLVADIIFICVKPQDVPGYARSYLLL